MPRPYHVIVNGWYFYCLNFLSGGAMLRSLPGILWHLVREPRKAAGVLPATVRHSYPLMERMWRSDIQPRYQAVVADARARSKTLPLEQLPALVDRLAEAAGEYFASITALAGAGVQAGDEPGPLLPALMSGRRWVAATCPCWPASTPRPDLPQHAVTSLDWWYPPFGEAAGHAGRRIRTPCRRAEGGRGSSRGSAGRIAERLREFSQLLADSQHLVPIREEQTAELTLPWPVMRRAVLRIGQALTDRASWLPRTTSSS